jgi:arginyl-tRNA synthetase
MNLLARVRRSLTDALGRAAMAGDLGEGGGEALRAPASWLVERPKRAEHGDLATNVAMVLCKRVGKPPRMVAEALVRALAGDAVIKSADVAGPGFVNLRLHPSAFRAEIEEILVAGRGYGRAPSATGERVNIEFVSANPTGPLHVGHARGAVFGDSVARLLEATGNRVAREYYINDFGNQTRVFAESVLAAAEGRPTPEGGYGGAYVGELARWLQKVDPAALEADRETLARTCITWAFRGIPGSETLRGIKQTLRDLDVCFDVWFSEESLYRWGLVAVARRQLEENGHLVRKEGALFFVATDEGADDKDRVVQKSDGVYTYFAGDIAYHADKIARGYDRLLTVLGADHHGYVARVRNAIEALGLPSSRFEAPLYQLVFIYRDGELVKFSKRAGNIVTAEEVIAEIDEAAGRPGAGRDALRFFLLSRSANTNVEFDLDLAKRKTLDNPVFYVQYGHARLCSILRKATSLGFALPDLAARPLTSATWTKLDHPDELAIALRLAEFPGVVVEAASGREPHRIVFYLQDLAREFQSYFTRLKDDPILPRDSERQREGWEASWDFAKTEARLAWIEAIRVVYASALDLLGVAAPERMDRPKDDELASDSIDDEATTGADAAHQAGAAREGPRSGAQGT